MESAVDEVRSFRCTVGSGQDAWARANDGLMSWFHRILQGHNHDAIASKWDSSRTQTHRRRGRRMRAESLSAANTTVLFQLGDTHDADAQIKSQMICIDQVGKASKRTTARFFG